MPSPWRKKSLETKDLIFRTEYIEGRADHGINIWGHWLHPSREFSRPQATIRWHRLSYTWRNARRVEVLTLCWTSRSSTLFLTDWIWNSAGCRLSYRKGSHPVGMILVSFSQFARERRLCRKRPTKAETLSYLWWRKAKRKSRSIAYSQGIGPCIGRGKSFIPLRLLWWLRKSQKRSEWR